MKKIKSFRLFNITIATILTFIYSIKPVYCINIIDVAKTIFVGWATNEEQHITDEIFASVFDATANTLVGVSDLIAKLFIAPFAPNFASLNTYLLGTSGITTYQIERFAAGIGLFITIVIFSISILKYFFSVNDDFQVKSTPISLFFRLLLSLVLIYESTSIIDTIIGNTNGNKIGLNKLWEIVLKAFVTSEEGLETFSKGIVNTYVNFGIEKIIFLGNPLKCPYTPLVGVLFLIINIIIVFKILKELLKLYMGMITNYLVFCFLIMFFGLAAATYVAKETSNTFVTYLKALGSQVVLLLSSSFFLAIGIKILMSLYVKAPAEIDSAGFLINLIWFLTYCKFVEKFGEFLRSIGMSPSVNAANLASSAGGGLRNLMMSMRGMDMARKGAAGTAQALGGAMMSSSNPSVAKTGKSLLHAGNIMGMDANSLLSRTAKGGSFMGNSVIEDMAVTGKANKKYADNIPDDTPMNIIEGMFRNPTNNEIYQNAYRAMPTNMQNDVLGAITGVAGAGGKITNSEVLAGAKGGIAFSGIDAQGKEFTGMLGQKAVNGAAITGTDGTKLANMSINPSLGRENQTFSLGNTTTGCSFGLAQAGISQVSPSTSAFLHENGARSIHMDSKGHNGTVVSDTGSVLGTFKNGEFNVNSDYKNARQNMANGMGLKNLEANKDFCNDSNLRQSWDAAIKAQYGNDAIVNYSPGSHEGQFKAEVMDKNTSPIASLDIKDTGRYVQNKDNPNSFSCKTGLLQDGQFGKMEDSPLSTTWTFTPKAVGEEK